MIQSVHAEKWHACGNDFILVSADLDDSDALSLLARRVCKTHTGIGADGIVAYDCLSTELRCRIFNLDGSEAQISGNGVRCLAGLLRRNFPGEGVFRIHSRAGLKTLTYLREDTAGALWFRADMGQPSFAVKDLPALLDVTEALPHPLQAAGRTVEGNLVSVGNPHCVVFVSDLGAEDWAVLGAALERHPVFPERSNVEFVRPAGPHEIDVRMWERGVGRTSSSGTGSCASAVASIRTGRVGSPVLVRTEAGALTVEWTPGSPMFLEGPAVAVWSGVVTHGTS